MHKTIGDEKNATGTHSVETRGDVDSLSVGNSSGNLQNDVGSFKEMTENKAFNSDSDLEDEIANNSEKVVNKEEVLINMSPKKYERAKDQLFIDFFKMYTNRAVKDTDITSNKSNQNN